MISIKCHLNLTPAEVHADLSLLGVSSEVHALVDDLELVPVVVDERMKRFAIARAFNRYSWEITLKDYVHKSNDYVEEVQGRLFEEN